MATYEELQARLNRAHGKMLESLPKVEATNEVDYDGEWTDEQRTAYGAAEKEVQDLNFKIKVFLEQKEREDAAAQTVKDVAAKASQSEDEAQHDVLKYKAAMGAFLRYGNGKGTAKGSMTDEQREMLTPALSRQARGVAFGLETGTDAAGGFGVPDVIRSEVLQIVGNRNILRQICTVDTYDSGREQALISIDETGEEGEAKAEGAATGTQQDPVLAERKMNFAVIQSKEIKMTDELSTDIALANFATKITEAAWGRIGKSELKAHTEETANAGNFANIVGFLSLATRGATAASATSIVLSDLLNLYASVKPEFRTTGVWVYHSSVFVVLLGLNAQTSGVPLWLPGNLASGEPATFLGKPIYENDEMGTIATGKKPVAFGDFRRYEIGDVAGTDVLFRFDSSNAADYAKAGEVGWLARRRVGGQLNTIAGAWDAIKVLTMG